jgi:alkylated DNA repair dioxygenase AlkB
MAWKKDGYQIIKKALSQDLVEVLAAEFRMNRDVTYHQANVDRRYRFAFGDELVRNSFIRYSLPGLESLQSTVLQRIVEKHTRLKLVPTYTYGRIYYHGAKMALHHDRPSCEVSVSLCLADDGVKWPLGLINRQGKKVYAHLNPGDILIYAGCELYHWRDKYKGREQIQAFLHYVQDLPKNRKLKFDGRPMLGLDPIKKGKK